MALEVALLIKLIVALEEEIELLNVNVGLELALLKKTLEKILTKPLKLVIEDELTFKLELILTLALKILLPREVILLTLKEPLILRLEFKFVEVPMPILPLLKINKWGLVGSKLLLALRMILGVAWIKKLFW